MADLPIPLFTILIYVVILLVNLILWGGVFWYVLCVRDKPDFAPGWWLICRTCRTRRSASEAGHIRLGANTGRISITLARCEGCQQMTWHTKIHESRIPPDPESHPKHQIRPEPQNRGAKNPDSPVSLA